MALSSPNIAWRVFAHYRDKDYPALTLICETPEEAIEIVRNCGFCLSSEAFTLYAVAAPGLESESQPIEVMP